MKLYKDFTKIVVAMLVSVMVCSLPSHTVLAADANNSEDEYGVSPCYTYTSYTSTSFSISNGDAICNTYAEGYRSSTTKITITQTLQKKSGSSWVDVWSWTNTEYYWYYSYTNYHYPLTKGATYRVKSCIKVYEGSNYETIYTYSGERTY